MIKIFTQKTGGYIPVFLCKNLNSLEIDLINLVNRWNDPFKSDYLFKPVEILCRTPIL